jgi:hypothetical protein
MASFLTSVHSSKRYLLDQNGVPFLVNADTPWGLIGGNPGGATTAQGPTGWSQYFTDRASNGFNAALIDVGSGPDASSNQPFTTFPTLNSAYWANVDSMLATAISNGISVYLGIADAYWLSTLVGGLPTVAQMTTYGQSLATRWANKTTYPGLSWFFGNDYGGSGAGSGNGTNFDTLYEGLLTGFANAGDNRPVTIELGFDESLSTDTTTWAARVSDNSVYTYNPTYEACLRAYAFSAPAMPAVFTEGTYENATNGAHPANPLDLRKQICWPLTCGCCGSFYGNDNLWPFASGWQTQLDTTDVTQRKAINNAFAALAWWKLVPDTGNHLVTAGRGSQFAYAGHTQTANTADPTYGHYVTAGVAADGSLAVIYNPDTTLNSITISAAPLASNPTITAIDPTNGATSSLGWTTTPTKGINAGGDHDWLFVVNASATVSPGISAQRLAF